MATATVPRRCEMAVLDLTGDSKTIWNPNNDAEVEVAHNTFNTLKAKGYIAYRVNASGDKGEIMTEFDPLAEKMIMAPALRGG